MSAPKIIGAVLLSLVLFISLCVFSVALTVKMTALNVSYVTSLAEDIPVTDIIEEAVRQGDVEQSEQLDILIGVIEDNEEALKERVIMFIAGVYEYLNSKSDNVNLTQLLGNSVLEDDFIISIVDSADLKPFLKEFIEGIITESGLPAGLSYLDYMDGIAADIEPWLKEQSGLIIPPALDYVLGNSDSFEVTVSIIILKDSLYNHLKQSFLSSPPQEFRGLSQSELGQTFDTLFEQASDDIPSSLTLDEELFASDDGTAINIDTTEFEQVLNDSREGIGIFNIAFISLIVLILLLIAGIILIYRNIKGAALNLGIVSSVFGICLLVFYMSSLWGVRDLLMLEISGNTVIRDWLIQMYISALFPILILFIIFIVVGIALLVTFFIYYRRQQFDTAPIYNDKVAYKEDDVIKPVE